MSSSGLTRIPIHPLEASLLRALASRSKPLDWIEFDDALSASKLSPDQLRRAVEWLKSKDLIETETRESTFYSLGEKGKEIASGGLPERKLVRLLQNFPSRNSFSMLSSKMGDEFSVALGHARKNGWIRIGKNQEITLEPDAAEKKEPEEELIEKVGSAGRILSSSLSPEERQTLDQLSKRQRGVIEAQPVKELSIRLTPKGLDTSAKLVENEIGEITPEVIKNKDWQQRHLRPIDVTSPAPSYFGGRKHPVRLFIEEVREAFLSLGFGEIRGPNAQSAFWNFDALFIPQHHSAREMQDTFYLSSSIAKISLDDKRVKSVRDSHESGKGTGSLGWGKGWQIDEARRVVLRTHTTAITIRYLADHRPDDARVFSVDKVFRNEKPNYKNNPEFYQIEGVMTAPGLNIRNLIYVMSQFYSKLGFNKVKFWPTYFPYTEPSLGPVVFWEDKQKWLELGGMGVFRPEVTAPLGIKNPVLAWGLGLDRLVMMKYGLQDIRDLYGANLSWLRKTSIL